MITWNRIFFHNPRSYLIEMIIRIHDYVIMFLIRIMFTVLIHLAMSYKIKFFSLEFFEHHQLERVWTLVPFFLLAFIVFPSLFTLYLLDSCFFCGMSINIIAHQWYWRYFYKEINPYTFDAYILPSSSTNIRLLDVDNRLVIPVRLPVRFLLSSSDVLHSWTIPSLGVKIDAVPGRVNQFCFSFKRSGVFFGQCSEICGTNHRFMPIVIDRVPFREVLSNLFN